MGQELVYFATDSNGMHKGFRCKECKHSVRVHRYNKRGRSNLDGYCTVMGCLCSQDRNILETVIPLVPLQKRL